VRVCLDLQTGAGGGALNHAGEAGCVNGESSFADEDEGRRRALALEPAQCFSHLVALNRVGAPSDVGPVDVQHGARPGSAISSLAGLRRRI
jgi:hypothetical protein